MEIENGKVVKLNYIGKLKENGQEFDNSYKRNQPLEFVCGIGMMIKGFEKQILGLKVGDEKTFEVSPEEGYGNVDAKLIQKERVPKNLVPKEVEVKKDMFLALKHPLTGQEVPARVVEIEENELLLEINLNPPLAGKYLIFEVKIEEVRDETKEEKEKREEEHKKQVEHFKKMQEEIMKKQNELKDKKE